MSAIDFMYQESFEIWRKKIDCDTGDLVFDEKWATITTTRERADIMVSTLNRGKLTREILILNIIWKLLRQSISIFNHL